MTTTSVIWLTRASTIAPAFRGYKRIAALAQLGRDTVEAVVWPMSEAAAVLLDRSLRLSEHETALEVGWLLSELERRFGYSLKTILSDYVFGSQNFRLFSAAC
jgi:hypothetical protein